MIQNARQMTMQEITEAVEKLDSSPTEPPSASTKQTFASASSDPFAFVESLMPLTSPCVAQAQPQVTETAQDRIAD